MQALEAINYNVGNVPKAVESADLDGDGDQDLIVANHFSNNVSLMLNNGQGMFSLLTNISVGNRPVSIAAGDLDNDGDLDFAVANNASNTVSVLLNHRI
ncbi:hypothetical protein CEN39_05865 [Fischerella thermalis CCMEE 5201]|nr:hypothetical protein CEN39_05865 [Fischerella thermalis CCMEE 5201]